MVKTESFFKTIGLIPKILRKRIGAASSVEIRELDDLKIGSEKDLFVQYDGEVFKAEGLLEITLFKQILPVYYNKEY
jgi:diacylglycerol kinase family enzyme